MWFGPPAEWTGQLKNWMQTHDSGTRSGAMQTDAIWCILNSGRSVHKLDANMLRLSKSLDYCPIHRQFLQIDAEFELTSWIFIAQHVAFWSIIEQPDWRWLWSSVNYCMNIMFERLIRNRFYDTPSISEIMCNLDGKNSLFTRFKCLSISKISILTVTFWFCLVLCCVLREGERYESIVCVYIVQCVFSSFFGLNLIFMFIQCVLHV